MPVSDDPELRLVCDLCAYVALPQVVGQVVAGENATLLRRIIAITGGTATGRLSGRVLPGGADYQTIAADGFTLLEAHYAIELPAGGLVYVRNSGMRHGPPEVMRRLAAGEAVDPALVYFRTVPKFETADPDHAWLMRSLFLGVGRREPDCVRLKVYEVL